MPNIPYSLVLSQYKNAMDMESDRAATIKTLQHTWMTDAKVKFYI